MLRRIVERASRGRVFRRKIRVGGKTVPILVTPDSQLKYLKPGRNAFDRDLIAIAETFASEGSVVWDVGANVGVLTFAAAAMAPKGGVVAIEADSWLADLLRRSAGLQTGGADVEVLDVAVSDRIGTASFAIAERGRASNALEADVAYSQMGGVRERREVPTVTLDHLLQNRTPPDFVKIDVEGAEALVIAGAGRMLTDVRPVFYVEVGREASDAVLAAFGAADYIAIGASGVRIDAMCEYNTYFVPAESVAAVETRIVALARSFRR